MFQIVDLDKKSNIPTVPKLIFKRKQANSVAPIPEAFVIKQPSLQNFWAIDLDSNENVKQNIAQSVEVNSQSTFQYKASL